MQLQRKMKMKQLQSMMEVEGVEEESELVMRFPRPYGVFDASENLISVRDASFAWTEGTEPLKRSISRLVARLVSPFLGRMDAVSG